MLIPMGTLRMPCMSTTTSLSSSSSISNLRFMLLLLPVRNALRLRGTTKCNELSYEADSFFGSLRRQLLLWRPRPVSFDPFCLFVSCGLDFHVTRVGRSVWTGRWIAFRFLLRFRSRFVWRRAPSRMDGSLHRSSLRDRPRISGCLCCVWVGETFRNLEGSAGNIRGKIHLQTMPKLPVSKQQKLQHGLVNGE